MAEKVGTSAEMPRLTSSQEHRSNAEAQIPRECFQRNVAIPLLHRIIMCILEQFSPSAKVATSLLGLVPSVLCSRNVNPQCGCWWSPIPWVVRNGTYAMEKSILSNGTAIKASFTCCGNQRLMLPCFQILASFSKLPAQFTHIVRHKRASMGKNRLSHLALLHIHYTTPVDLDTVVDCCAPLHPRRLQLENLPQ